MRGCDQGGWEDDETMAEAACREALEEAGVRGILNEVFFLPQLYYLFFTAGPTFISCNLWYLFECLCGVMKSFFS